MKDVLGLHWEIGQEICDTRVTNDASYRELARATGALSKPLKKGVTIVTLLGGRVRFAFAWSVGFR